MKFYVGLLLMGWTWTLCGQRNTHVLPFSDGKTRFRTSDVYGSLRADHFHMGRDLSTLGRERRRVRASATGWVEELGVSREEYGWYILLRHPNGQSTIYAHLDAFYGEIAKWLSEEQYRLNTAEGVFKPPARRFRVRQRELLAWSGNTGRSTGPHLHFEIRNQKNQALPPNAIVKLPRDKRHPRIRQIALRTTDTNSRINGQAGRIELKTYKYRGKYHLRDKLALHGNITLEVRTYDNRQGSGIARISLNLDRKHIFTFKMDKLDQEKQQAYYTHAYVSPQKPWKRFIRLYPWDGYNSNAQRGEGKMRFKKGVRHRMTLHVWDRAGNRSSLIFRVNQQKLFTKISPNYPDGISYSVLENLLTVRFPIGNPAKASFHLAHNKIQNLHPSYHMASRDIYLWDLRWGIPDHVTKADQRINLSLQQALPKENKTLSWKHLKIKLPQNALYDTTYMDSKYHSSKDQIHEIFELNNQDMVLGNEAKLWLYPEKKYITPRTHVYRLERGKDVFLPTTWDHKGGYVFDEKSIGRYTLKTDTIPPNLRVFRSSASELVLTVSDDMSGIDRWEASLNGEWLLMSYFPKKEKLYAIPQTPSTPFWGTFECLIYDKAGNMEAIALHL